MVELISNGTSSNTGVEDILLNGKLQPPEPRVAREGAPDNRPKHRQIPLRLKAFVQREIMPGVFANQFKYSPITEDQIRLLSIRPGKKEDPMHCLIFKRKLSEVKGCYEALSYCWGTDRTDCKIYIQDLNVQSLGDKKIDFREAALITAPKRFYVRPNLYAAMLHLRKRNKEVNIWVDAICINQGQDGEEEKQQQLAQMANIYNSASNVCIWLGEEDVRSASALQLVRKIMDFQNFDILMKNLDAKSQWCDLIEIMKAPWFSRRWIIQEVVMARSASVHCGTEVIHWDDFSDAVSLLNDKVERLRDRFGDYDAFGDVEGLSASILVKTISNVCRKSDDGDVQEKLMDLETLVSSLLSFQATIPHDTIYSLLAIAKDCPQESETQPFGITANYKRSTRDLYIAFVKRCIETSGCLDIICRHWAPPVRDLLAEEVQLPSWISKLSKSPFGLLGESQGRQNGENFVGFSSGDVRKKYNASRGTSPTFIITEKALVQSPLSSPITERPTGFGGSMEIISEDPQPQSSSNVNSTPVQGENTRPKSRVHHPSRASSRMEDKERDEKLSGILKVSGFKLGTIKKQSDVIRGGILPGDWLKRAGWDKTKNQNRVPDRLWRTLVADRGPEGSIPPGWYKRACLHCLVDTRIIDGRGNLTVASHLSRRTAEMTANFLKRVESVVWNRRLFEAVANAGSDQLLFGLAPEETEVDDEVCILFGCTVPVVLRRVKLSNTPLYELIGEAYVHGKMDGEAVEDQDLVDRSRQWFELQ